MHPHFSSAGRSPGGRLASVLVLGALVVALGCSSTAPPPLLGIEPLPYTLGPPDRVTVTVFPEPVIEQELVVRPDGMISVDLIGDVKAKGRTPEEVAAEIEQRIARYKRDPKVNVAVQSALSSQVTILGEVNSQQTFPLQQTTRLAHAMGFVGGVTMFAREQNIRVIRTDGEKTHVYVVDLDAIMKGDLSTNLVLQGGDLVVVPPTGWAAFGKSLQAIFFPIQQMLGFGAQITTKVFTGGAF